MSQLEDSLDGIEIFQLKPVGISRVAKLINRILRFASPNVEPWWLDRGFESTLVRSIEKFAGCHTC